MARNATGLSGWAAIAALDDATPGELRALAQGLTMAGGTFAVFGPPIGTLAVIRELGDKPDELCELSMCVALWKARYMLEGDAGAQARLDLAEEPFWVAVRETLAAAR
jgi:hypothetical protein